MFETINADNRAIVLCRLSSANIPAPSSGSGSAQIPRAIRARPALPAFLLQVIRFVALFPFASMTYALRPCPALPQSPALRAVPSGPALPAFRPARARPSLRAFPSARHDLPVPAVPAVGRFLLSVPARPFGPAIPAFPDKLAYVQMEYVFRGYFESEH